MLRSLQYRDRSAGSRNRDGAVSLRGMPHSSDVHTWCDKCTMFLLSHCQPGYGSESSCACKLRELPYAAHVPVRRKICEMRGLQFCDISWGLTWCRPEAQQLKSQKNLKAASQKDAFECTCIEFSPEAILFSSYLPFPHFSLPSLDLASSRNK